MASVTGRHRRINDCQGEPRSLILRAGVPVRNCYALDIGQNGQPARLLSLRWIS